MTKKIKELKDKDLKDLFAATDTIPNHTKKEAKASASEKKAAASASGTSGENTGSSTTSKKKEHHKDGSGHHGSSHHHRDHHSGSHSSHKADKDHIKQNKRRNSEVPDADGGQGPKASKMAKTEINASAGLIGVNDNSGGIMKKKPEELKMGRIPKIKKPPGSELNSSSTLSSANTNSNDHNKLYKELKIKEEHSRDGHKSSKSKDAKDKSSSKLNKKSSEVSGDQKTNSKSSSSSSKKRPHHSSEDESNKISSKKHKDGHRHHSSSGGNSKDGEKLRENKDHHKHHRDKSAENRRKSTSSQASNASGSNKNPNKNREINPDGQKKKMPNIADHLNSDSESDFSDDDKEPKKFSIFDDPIIDPDNPVYFSMYDKVKARRSCVARRDREENERRQQEALLAKFSKLKAKKDKRKSNGSDSDSDDDEGLFTILFWGFDEKKISLRKRKWMKLFFNLKSIFFLHFQMMMTTMRNNIRNL